MTGPRRAGIAVTLVMAGVLAVVGCFELADAHLVSGGADLGAAALGVVAALLVRVNWLLIEANRKLLDANARLLARHRETAKEEQ